MRSVTIAKYKNMFCIFNLSQVMKKISLGTCDIDFYEHFYSKQKSENIKKKLGGLPYETHITILPLPRKGKNGLDLGERCYG